MIWIFVVVEIILYSHKIHDLCFIVFQNLTLNCSIKMLETSCTVCWMNEYFILRVQWECYIAK